MVEKNLQSTFSAWVRKNPPLATTAWELKLEKGKSIAFDRVAPHQVDGLTQAKRGGLFHKIADSPVSWMRATPMRFGKPKPFDCAFLVGAEAYVVVVFYKPRKKKEVIFIDIDAWVQESKISTRKSLTEARAREISSKIEFI